MHTTLPAAPDNVRSIVVAGVTILQDERGRFNLNLLHKASGTGDAKRPSLWIANKQTQALIAELDKQLSRNSCLDEQSPNSGLGLEVRKGGVNPGIYAHELLVVSYAGWVSAAFQLQVNKAFLDSRKNTADSTSNFPVPRTFAEALQLAADQARLIESQQEQIQVMAPKADYADRLLGAEETVDMEVAAKVLRTSRPKLMRFLRERGVLTAANLPMQIYIERDLMRVQQTPYKDVFGRDKLSVKTVLTQRGLLYVRSLLDSLERQRTYALSAEVHH